MRKTWNDEQLALAVARCTNVCDTMAALGLKTDGRTGNGTWSRIKRRISDLKLDTSHWKRQHAEGFKWKSLDDLLSGKTSYTTTNALRDRLVKEGLLTYHCYECKMTEWRGKEIGLQLDHINGNNRDNSLTNLRLLCPNCHSQTPTYCRGMKPNKGAPRRAKGKQPTRQPTSKHPGVCYHIRLGWQVFIGSGKKRKHIGYYQTEEEAIAARLSS